MSGFHPEGIILGRGGGAPGNGCGFICFSIQLSQILGGISPPPDETLDVYIISSSSNELFLDFHYVVDNDILIVYT